MDFLKAYSFEGVDLNIRDGKLRTVVHQAALEQDLGALECLIELCPQNVDAVDAEVSLSGVPYSIRATRRCRFRSSRTASSAARSFS